MDKDSVLYLLIDMRVNGILDRILERDEEYQEIVQKSGEYLDRLEAMELPKEARSLIDLHSCEQNAFGARYGALAYLLGFSDCVELMTKLMHLTGSHRYKKRAHTCKSETPTAISISANNIQFSLT